MEKRYNEEYSIEKTAKYCMNFRNNGKFSNENSHKNSPKYTATQFK